MIEAEEKAEKPEAQAEEAKPEAQASEAAEAKAEETTPEEKSEEVKAEIRRLKLKYNGEEIEKEEPEVIELAQKGFDYTKKTMDLAKEREDFRVKSKQELDAKLNEYAEKIALNEKVIKEAVIPGFEKIDWNKLMQESPIEYAQKLQQVSAVAAKLDEIHEERKKIEQQREKEHKESEQRRAKEAVEILQKEIPGGWSDQVYGSILKSGVEHGFKAEEVQAITDPRAIKVLWKAMQYDALQKAKPQVDKKVAQVPKVAKPGTAEKPDQKAEAWKKGMAQLKKSGSTQDAVALAKMFIE